MDHGTPVAVIVSDLPIVARAAGTVFADRYHLVAHTWNEFLKLPVVQADLVMIDVTLLKAAEALALVRRMVQRGSIAVFSLHENEVMVYRIDPTGVEFEREWDSLFALAA